MFHLSPSAWLPLCQPALGPAASKEVRETPRELCFQASWAQDQEKLHSLLGREGPPWVRSPWTTQGRLRRSLRKHLGQGPFPGHSLGQEVQWQKGRLKMSSGNKVNWPEGKVTEASTHRVPVMPEQCSGYILTSSNARPALGPSQGPLPGEESRPSNPSTGLRCSELAQDHLASPKGKPWPTQPGTPSGKANRFSGVRVVGLG